MNYVIRITGPGVDHQVLVNSAEDFEALELIIAKMRKHFEAETPEKHSTEDDFQHFLSYSGLGASYQRLGRDVIDLRVAYYTGAGIDVTEPCSACGGTGEIDETLGGIATSDPHAPCPDCTPKAETPEKLLCDCPDGACRPAGTHNFRCRRYYQSKTGVK